MSETRVEVLSDIQCFALLGQVPVGRIGVTIGALPVILPVNFATVDGSVIFRTVTGTKLSATTANSVVAFEVDSYEPEGRSGWSVLVQGIASEVTDPAPLERYLAALGTPWGVAEVADRVVTIEIERITGRRFRTTT